jgi:acyl-CoA synthetase (AMP-forming)/AMP-acid ligase II
MRNCTSFGPISRVPRGRQEDWWRGGQTGCLAERVVVLEDFARPKPLRFSTERATPSVIFVTKSTTDWQRPVAAWLQRDILGCGCSGRRAIAGSAYGCGRHDDSPGVPDRPIPAAAGDLVQPPTFLIGEPPGPGPAQLSAPALDGDHRRLVRTGGLGKVDEDGYFCIVDRKKDLMLGKILRRE